MAIVILSASAISLAAAKWIATEMRWRTKASHVRADHVVSSYSDEVSLLLRHSSFVKK